MSQVLQQPQVNRSERRRLQRMESKKWRKEERKMMKSDPNGGRYNPKKSRRIIRSESAEPTSVENTISNNSHGPRVSIKNRDFIVIDKVFDGILCDTESNKTEYSLCADDTNEDTSIDKQIKMEEMNITEEKVEFLEAVIPTVSNIIEKENVCDDACTTNENNNPDVKNVTVSEVPVSNENTNDGNNETPSIKSDTFQEEEVLQVVSGEEQSDSCITIDTNVEQEQETILKKSLQFESDEIVPIPSASDKDLSESNDDSLSNTDKALEQLNTEPIIDKSSISTNTSTTVTTIAKTRNKKRSIISRLFKNNKIEIKQKPQEKKVISVTEQTEKKKVKSWQIWRKF